MLDDPEWWANLAIILWLFGVMLTIAAGAADRLEQMLSGLLIVLAGVIAQWRALS